MIDSTTLPAWMTRMAAHLRVLGRLNSAWAIQPPCVLDLRSHARPQSHTAVESII
jgi:hypothetical protein